MTKETLLTVEDVMRVLRLSRLTVYRAIYAGRLKALKVPGSRVWRVRPDELQRFIKAGTI